MMKRRALGKIIGRPVFWGGLTVVACNVMGDPPGATGDDGGAATAGIGGGNNGGSAGRGGDASAGDGDADGSGGTGATDTGPWWQKQIGETCESEGVPKPSDRPVWVQDSTSLAPIYMAQTRIRFGTTNDDRTLSENLEAWREIGFDFDETCTSSVSCYVPPNELDLVKNYACVNPLGVGDGRKCRDNQIGKIFKIAESSNNVGQYFGMTEQDWNCELYRGGFSIIYKVSNYNGKLNDPTVRVDLYNSIGTKTPQGWHCRSTDAGSNIAGTLDPNWYDNSAWPTGRGEFLIPHRNVLAGTPEIPGQLPNAAVHDALAFVRNGILFATFPPGSEVALLGSRTPVPGFRLILDRGTLAAQIFQDTENAWMLKGTLAGVVSQGLMIESFKEIGFCENICGSYKSVVEYLDVNKDTLRVPGPATEPCDALSYATTLVAKEASVVTTLDTSLTGYNQPLNKACPEPRHPAAPRQNCTCNAQGNSVCPPAG